MIKAVIFDVGGVLLRTEDLSGRRKWEARFGLKDWELANAVFNCPAAEAATVGRATEAEVWESVRQQFNLSQPELVELRKDFWSGDRFDDSLLDWVTSLRGCYRTGILSNAWGGARKFLAGHPKIVAAFEELVISAEEGVMKPQAEIYARAVQRLNVLPSEAVFVDDVLVNIEAAQKAGLFGVHFRAGMDVPGALKEFGVA
ncbi:MAG: HAD family phosphatase [Chloroflexi bacterium]|nr:HAD family phosphatase [Chloroflexota bacterium]